MIPRLAVALRIVGLNCALALVPPIILLTIGGSASWPRLLANFRYSLVYSNSIGSLAFLLVPFAWMRSCSLPSLLRWPARFGAMLASCLLGCGLAGAFFLAAGWQSRASVWPEVRGSFLLATFLTLVAGVAIGIFRTLRHHVADATLRLQNREFEHERAIKLATEARLSSLESRIHPHFLFNALNSISSLIPEDPARAERLIEQMAALLRFSLDAGRSGLVPLAGELKIVADYLDIERARFGARLRYSIDVPDSLNGLPIPPLSLQTLVENSVKHAVSPDRAGGEIRIRAFRRDESCLIEVADTGPAFDLARIPSGHGLDNLKERLAVLYGSSAALSLNRDRKFNRVLLSLPLHSHAGISG